MTVDSYHSGRDMRKPVQRAAASYIRGLKFAALAAAACAIGTANAAEELLPEQYFSFGINYIQPDYDPADYGIGFDVGYARRFGESNWLEGKVGMNILETGSDTMPDFYQTLFGVDYIRSLTTERTGHFFLLAGGGLSINDVSPDTEDGSSYYLNAGIGYRGGVSQTWGVRPRVDVRFVHDSLGDGSDSIVLGFKVEIPPNRKTVVEVEKIVEKETTCVIPVAPVATPVE